MRWGMRETRKKEMEAVHALVWYAIVCVFFGRFLKKIVHPIRI